jgi:hypothetical protein
LQTSQRGKVHQLAAQAAQGGRRLKIRLAYSAASSGGQPEVWTVEVSYAQGGPNSGTRQQPGTVAREPFNDGAEALAVLKELHLAYSARHRQVQS